MRTQEGTRSLVSRGYQLWSPHFEADNNSHTFNLFFNNIRLLCLHDLPPRYWVCCLLPFPILRISSRRALQGSQTRLLFAVSYVPPTIPTARTTRGSPQCPIQLDARRPSLPLFPVIKHDWLVGFLNAAHATDFKTRRSVTVYLLLFCCANTAWKHCIQPFMLELLVQRPPSISDMSMQNSKS